LALFSDPNLYGNLRGTSSKKRSRFQLERACAVYRGSARHDRDLYILVSKKLLNGADVIPGFQ